jgi:hypothetical protein
MSTPSSWFPGKRQVATATLGVVLFPIVNPVQMAGQDARAAASAAPAPDQPTITWNRESGQVTLVNGRLELIVETKSGVNARSLRDLSSGQVFADDDYAWPGGAFPGLAGTPVVTRDSDGTSSVVFDARLGAVAVEQAFAAPAREPGVILECISIRNTTTSPVATADFKCGFGKRVRQGETWLQDASGIRFCPVPYRRETNGKLQEFPLREVTEHGSSFSAWMEPVHPTPMWGAEGWVWSKESVSLLVAKYNPTGMEWSLMEPIKRGMETLVRFGGAGQWKHGHPEGSARLDRGKSYRFGETRLEAVDGDWRQAYYAYRRYTERKGCATPKGYHPPVHWNELYDNQYFFKVGTILGDQKVWYTPGFDARNKKLLQEFYSRDLMLAEAAKARELGCEALYLDPGWDTGPSHHLWDASRLGSMELFVKMIREEYGLRVSLWIGLGGVPPTYADPQSCPPEARVVDKDGRATQVHCFASPAFLDTKAQRLLELCRQGIAFMMFDSTQYSGPCYSKAHGHQIPATREEHAHALLELTQRIKQKYPRVLIEMHDPVTGPSGIHYTPTYYGYAPPGSFDCLWGHEFMWNPIDDLLSRRAVSLYYYNLAYSIPLYLHVNLKGDNENALVFWWYASTCRHLGVGGKPTGTVWEAEKKAMQAYQPLKQFYTQGVFYGLDEMTHAHTLPELGESVINAFNLEDKPAQKPLRFRLGEIGLRSGVARVEGAPFKQAGEEVALELTLPARGHQLLKVRTTAGKR